MKYTKIILPLIFVSLFFVSCSWITDFVISNKSDKNIALKYHYKRWKAKNGEELICPDLEKLGYPEITSEKNLERSNEKWRDIAKKGLHYDRSSCEVRCVLPAGQSIRITSMGTYTGHKEGSDTFFLIQSLAIKSDQGLIHYEEYELLKRFKKKSKALYILEYK